MLPSQGEPAAQGADTPADQGSASAQPPPNVTAANLQPQQTPHQSLPALLAQLPPELQNIANALAQTMSAYNNLQQSGNRVSIPENSININVGHLCATKHVLFD